MKALLTASFVLLTVLFCRAQKNDDRIESLIDLVLADTVVDDQQVKTDIVELANTIRADQGQAEKMFPFSEMDSVVLFTFNQDIPLYLEFSEGEPHKSPYQIFDRNGLKENLEFDHKSKLLPKEIEELLNVVNDPNNFLWGGVIGPNFATALFAFYNDGQVVSYIRLNSLGQVASHPKSKRMKYGTVTGRTGKWFDLFITGKVPSFERK